MTSNLFNSCPPPLKEEILRLLQTDRFTDAKVLWDQWQPRFQLIEIKSNFILNK